MTASNGDMARGSPTRRAWFLRRQRRPLRTDCPFRRVSRPGSGITRQQRVQQRARSVLCGARLDLARQLMLDVVTRDPREAWRWRSRASHRPAATSSRRNDAAFWTRSSVSTSLPLRSCCATASSQPAFVSTTGVCCRQTDSKVMRCRSATGACSAIPARHTPNRGLAALQAHPTLVSRVAIEPRVSDFFGRAALMPDRIEVRVAVPAALQRLAQHGQLVAEGVVRAVVDARVALAHAWVAHEVVAPVEFGTGHPVCDELVNDRLEMRPDRVR